MKRKRGHKKGKSKKLPLVEAVAETVASPNSEEVMSANTEESSGSDEENDNKAAIEVEPDPVKVETKIANIRPDGLIERPPPTAVYGRVKVKLKTSKPPVFPQVPSSEASRCDADKSSQQVNVDKEQGQGVVVASEKVEDSGNSLSESKKSTGIKIVSSKGLSPPGASQEDKREEQEPKLAKQGSRYNKQELEASLEDMGNSMPESKKSAGIKIVSSKVLSLQGGKESGASGSSQEDKREEQEPKLGQKGSRYNKQELEASLEVIKKVMKMDAAEPFNVPVNPVELGIPDYFDVIDTPMDFGTVRSNLERGAKYMNSEDVYKDVHYIWDNCYKYNNKGDYIVDLMKRVKKNFMKYWMTAGLYTDQAKKTNGGESIPVDEATTSGHGKKFKRGKGVKRHKDDCMCAICIMKRRRREREAREAQEAHKAGAQVASPRAEVTMTGLPQEYKQEENSHAESPHGEDTSSYMETSPDVDADAEVEGEEMRVEGVAPQYGDEQKGEDDRVDFRDKSDRSGDMSEKSQRSDKGETESYSHVEEKVRDESGSRIKIDAQKQLSVQPEGQMGRHLQQRHELLELEKKRQRLRLMETFRDLENPMLLGLCGTLFPNKPQSVWNGANSLVRCESPCHTSDIHKAVASFMTPSSKSASSLK